ncbi:hypothetical protein EKO27_g7983 [Xylaria grammica]|uniref:Protein kinase domain-containing protein n=1 Tax=Xylaria grammica TaxID=363999 RepID=A0A439CY19_9PEZI|nr:hypothetical protein EKO27_g7983 [Xylaria grammica]
MSDPFNTPPRGGRGGRGQSTPPPAGRGRGGGRTPGDNGGGRGSPDPFGPAPVLPPRTNPFVGPATRSGWSSSSSEGRSGSRDGRRRRGPFRRGGLFGAHAPSAEDDPFGGPSVASGAERRRSLQRAIDVFRNDYRFTVEKATVTTNGVQLRVVEAPGGGHVPRRFVAKASFPAVARAVAMERDWMHRFRFARHIVRWLTLTPDPMAPGPGNVGFNLPYFFMEYLENGTLRQFEERVQNVTRLALPDGSEIAFLLPNRLLWTIFLCLIRACVGMAWPPEGPDAVLEAPTESEPSTFAHMDLQNENVMFGDLEESEAEHRTVPIVKLIDLGEANERPAGESSVPPDPSAVDTYDNVLLLANYRPNTGRRNQGIDRNLLDVGVLMASLISKRTAFVVTCRRNMMDPSIHPFLDADLRLLIQRCLAVDPENRPRLEELMELVGRDDSPFFRGASYYKRDQGFAATGAVNPAEVLETDEVLRFIIQACILNADPNTSSRI